MATAGRLDGQVSMVKRLTLRGRGLRLADLEAVAWGHLVRLVAAPAALRGMRRSRRVLEEKLARGETVYGVNTGFGRLARVPIDRERLEELQVNLLHSHAAGVGDPLGAEEARLMLLLRIQTLLAGYSGVRPDLVRALTAIFNAGIVPLVPEEGSVGACGDLAPLAHLGLIVIGEGEAFYEGRRMSGGEALRCAGLRPFRLSWKEGLALVNGTQMSTAILLRTYLRAERLADAADRAAALSLEALRGSVRPFDPAVQEVRPHAGQTEVARRIRRFLRGSRIRASHRNCPKVQDAYSLRCVPQVHGAVRDALALVRRTLEVEINAATDNPLVFPETGRVLSAGNFHGQPVALSADILSIVLSTLAGISERRIETLVNPDLSGMPAFLTSGEGLHSGYMMAQVTAAALLSETKVLAHPASVDSIPTSANQEDHVSMSAAAARQARAVADSAERILAIEFLCGAQGLEFGRPLRGGEGVEEAYRVVRERVPRLTTDRSPAPDIEVVRGLLDRLR